LIRLSQKYQEYLIGPLKAYSPPKSTHPRKLAKIKSFKAARGLWPMDTLCADSSDVGSKPHDGIFDALLMAEYARRQHFRCESIYSSKEI